MEQDIVERTQEQDGAERAQTVRVDLDGLGEYTYFMTDDWNAVRKTLTDLGYRTPVPNNWRWNPALHQNVRAKMAELGAKYSLTMSHGANVLNSWSPNAAPHIIFLSELAKPQETKALRDILTPAALGMPPLLYACVRGDAAAVRRCIELGADMNVLLPDFDMTPLMFAAARNETEVVQVLIQNGADISMRSKKGYYALLYALVMGAKETIRILEAAGAKLERISPTPDINKTKAPFTEKFLFYLQNSVKYSKNKSFAPVYKRCGMRRQTFSKIMGEDSYYRPKKDTVFQLAIGMRLTIEQTKDLLESTGHHLLPDDAFDATVADFISRMDYDLRTIDEALFKKTNRTLCSYK
ncbi:MAG: ankyrin repeat domain-containing protein [Treponemataceae bacterium]|nr:ankyrin repeat domain-containing protein [Treponemataceae bacterium]